MHGSTFGNGIRRWAPYRHVIAEILVRPEVLIRGERGESKAVGQVPKTCLGPKYLVVVYREASGQKHIITAYFTSSLKKVKGDIVWRA